MKVFAAHFCHETDAFSSIPTTLESYRENFLYRPSEPGAEEQLDRLKGRRNLFSTLRNRGHDVIIGLIAVALPSRPTPRADYDLLKGELLTSLEAACPVDAVALSLHGAQVTEDLDDCESDIVRSVRAIVGEAVPIGVILDLHGNVGPDLLDAADIVLAGIEYPHTDMLERGELLVGLLERMAAGALAPNLALAPIPMSGFFFTTREPLKGLLSDMVGLQGRDGVAAISFMHGFAAANVPRGASVIVVSERDETHAQSVADEMARRLFGAREAIMNKPMTVDDAVREAAAAARRPALIAEISDNPGAGASGDATWLLARMLEAGLGRSLFGLLWDPMAVRAASMAGVGARTALRIGGKAGRPSGAPLDVEATIVSRHEHLVQRAFGAEEDLGPAVVIRVGETDIVMISKRQQVLSPSCFRAAGLEPADYAVIGIKSVQHFHAEFAPLAPTVLYASHVLADPSRRERLKRPVWPRDETPFVVDGVAWGEPG